MRSSAKPAILTGLSLLVLHAFCIAQTAQRVTMFTVRLGDCVAR
jgi:hypothetical protein